MGTVCWLCFAMSVEPLIGKQWLESWKQGQGERERTRGCGHWTEHNVNQVLVVFFDVKKLCKLFPFCRFCVEFFANFEGVRDRLRHEI